MRLPARVRLALTLAALALGAALPAGSEPVGCPSDTENEVLEEINREREGFGLPPLQMDVRLVEAARLHSQDMAERRFFSHVGSDGSQFWERVERAGYPLWGGGETIAAGYRTPRAAVEGWMDSPPHREILLGPDYRDVGVGFVQEPDSPYGSYWTADFGWNREATWSPSELCGRAACDDGIDNDGDGLVDGGDVGCDDPLDDSERSPLVPCDDGLDNDEDGLADFDDPDCSPEQPYSECGDGFQTALLLPAVVWLRRRAAKPCGPGPGKARATPLRSPAAHCAAATPPCGATWVGAHSLRKLDPPADCPGSRR